MELYISLRNPRTPPWVGNLGRNCTYDSSSTSG